MHRKPDGEKYDKKLLDDTRGAPWKTIPSTSATSFEPLPPVVEIPQLPEATPAAFKEMPEPVPRQLDIRKEVELKKYGYTPDCIRCNAFRQGKTTTAPHSAACRRRIEEAVRADPEFQVRTEQQDARFAKRLEETQQPAQQPAKRKAEGSAEEEVMPSKGPRPAFSAPLASSAATVPAPSASATAPGASATAPAPADTPMTPARKREEEEALETIQARG